MTKIKTVFSMTFFSFLFGGVFFGMITVSNISAHPRVLQGNGQPSETKELLKKIQKEMSKIDELLNQAANQSRTGSRGISGSSLPKGKQSGKEQVQKLLKESSSSNSKVIKLIDQLLAKAQRDSSSSGSSMKPPKDSGKPSGKKKPKPDNRERNSPDLQKQKKQSASQNPKNPKNSKEKAKLKKGNLKPNSGKTGDPNNAKGSSRWGFLPPYLQFLFRKGGSPKVPGKYEKWAEEFNRNVDRKKK